MENQHGPNQNEIDRMNKIEAEGLRLSALLDECRAIDVTEGIMALTRSVAKPGFF